MTRQNLQTHRQSVCRLSARDAHARNSCQIAGDCKDIGQVHRHRIVHLLAQLERRKRRDRRDHHVHFGERLREIARDQGPHLLRLDIIRVVVARAQHVGSQHNPTLALRAEAFAARFAIHVGERIARSQIGAARVAHPVITREIRAGLRGRDDVIGRDRVGSVRQRHFAHFASQRLQHFYGAINEFSGFA